MNNELQHHGIKGMKWGVRRYQNYDGSYTREGMRRYNESMSNYENAKKLHDTAKGYYKQTKKNGYAEVNGKKVAVDKSVVRDAKNNLKDAKKRLNRDYDQLAKDKLADQGKELYRSGKTITGSYANRQVMATTAVGAATVGSLLYKNGRTDLAVASAAIGVGIEAVNGIMMVKNAYEAKRLRAYYSHSRPKD